MSTDALQAARNASRIGLGLAAVGRPSYINMNRRRDLPSERSVSAMRTRTHELLDAAYDLDVRYVDVARSYGLAEKFLAEWLDLNNVQDMAIGSKWGYTYTANWRPDAATHEVKDHSLSTFSDQLLETRGLLGERLDVYQIHSLTPESPALTDIALHERLAVLADSGTTVGFSTSGPRQAHTIEAALAIEINGEPLFRSVQSTFNVLETSAGSALREAHERGCFVIIKEGLANGRLAEPHESLSTLVEIAEHTHSSTDAVALAAILHNPWVDVVLSGAATTEQLASNVRAPVLDLDENQISALNKLTEPAEHYWQFRSTLNWQ
ncbi:MAG: aldo/keto reductase [Corynebacteriales bacterium]|nr:aldo/keto reductase [Mycobacteriales bacterium]